MIAAPTASRPCAECGVTLPAMPFTEAEQADLADLISARLNAMLLKARYIDRQPGLPENAGMVLAERVCEWFDKHRPPEDQ